eukprot:20921-Heterococcus_DN1.PRE.4
MADGRWLVHAYYRCHVAETYLASAHAGSKWSTLTGTSFSLSVTITSHSSVHHRPAWPSSVSTHSSKTNSSRRGSTSDSVNDH